MELVPKFANLTFIALAAVIAVMAILTTVAYATGVFSWIAEWTDTDFYYSKDTETEAAEILISDPEERFKTIEEALTYYNAPENILPTYIPEGYELGEEGEGGFEYGIIVNQLALFDLWYSNGENTISFTYVLNSTKSAVQFSKDGGDPEIYTVNGVDHYIMTNADKYLAIWQNGNFECSISGYESREELIKTIDSIYEG